MTITIHQAHHLPPYTKLSPDKHKLIHISPDYILKLEYILKLICNQIYTETNIQPNIYWNLYTQWNRYPTRYMLPKSIHASTKIRAEGVHWAGPDIWLLSSRAHGPTHLNINPTLLTADSLTLKSPTLHFNFFWPPVHQILWMSTLKLISMEKDWNSVYIFVFSLR